MPRAFFLPAQATRRSSLCITRKPSSLVEKKEEEMKRQGRGFFTLRSCCQADSFFFFFARDGMRCASLVMVHTHLFCAEGERARSHSSERLGVIMHLLVARLRAEHPRLGDVKLAQPRSASSRWVQPRDPPLRSSLAPRRKGTYTAMPRSLKVR